jgi:beta-lactamase class A
MKRVALVRRDFLAFLAATAAAPAFGEDRFAAARQALTEIEQRDGGRLGVAVLDTGSGAYFGHRDDERFPMCSTFKALAAAAVLRRVDSGEERLDRRVGYGAGDMLDYAPVAKAHLAEGFMTVGDICAGAIAWSDNVAANLLLQAIGGPAGFTAFARLLGDDETRLDRNEPALNECMPRDPRDTTAPRAMLASLRAVLLGETLSLASRSQLAEWMIGDKVGDRRIRAGLPPDWKVGDKTGSGDHGTANVVAIIWPPDRAPILATSYLTQSPGSADARNLVHSEVGALIAKTF